MRKKWVSTVTLAMIVLAGCSQGEAESSNQVSIVDETEQVNQMTEIPQTPTDLSEFSVEDGEYEGEAMGYGNPIRVKVMVEDHKIANIDIIEENETEEVYQRAQPIIVERILDNNSPEVDSVSAATYTSTGIKKAAAEALNEAGAQFENVTNDTGWSQTANKEEAEDIHTDVVIVGSGPAGLTAAITAKEQGAENVTLIEKLDILSGNGKFNLNFFGIYNTVAMEENEENPNDITKESFIEDHESAQDSSERLDVWAEGAGNIDGWLRERGIELNHNFGEMGHTPEKDMYSGNYIQTHLEELVEELGIDVHTGTQAVDLLFDGDAVTGVAVETRTERFNINARSTVIATGGFSNNKELLEEYMPGVEKLETSNQMGATGDFVDIFKKHDIELDSMDISSIFRTILLHRRDLTGHYGEHLYVNNKGERFADELSGGLELAETILDQPDQETFLIYDQKIFDENFRNRKHYNMGEHLKADSIKELAEKAGIDAVELEETLTAYNQAVDGEQEDPFREEAPEQKLDLDGPLYAAPFQPAIHMTKGGVLADEKTQVLNTDRKVVPGLFAAGEVTSTGGSYSSSVIFGREAGKYASEFLNQ